MIRLLPSLLVLSLVPSGLSAQDEKALRKALEGQLVAPRIDMPGTTAGVNVFPYRPTPLEGDLGRDLAEYGVGVPMGRAVRISRIKVKKEHIEFQLGEGGERQEPTFSNPYVGKSREEKRLEDDIKKTKDAKLKRQLEDRLRDLQDRRRREEDRLEALARIEHELKLSQRTPEEWALMAGSRFNVRFDTKVPAEALTSEGLRSMLARWVDFEPPPGSESVTPLAGPAELRKGMPMAEVELNFGEPTGCQDSDAGGLALRTCKWSLPEGHLEAQFVDGVLVKYTFSSGPN
jgi:hypothetical protein